jgi:predicted TIM-barrel fold metal-dependent hydrolase
VQRLSMLLVTLAVFPLAVSGANVALPPPRFDHHQHLFRTGLPRAADPGPFDSERLTRYLDEAGIQRAVVLSLAYQMGNPHRPVDGDEYEQVRAENDWTSRQVALRSDRLVGFCGFNPLKAYALQELRRCAADPHIRAGIKLHFGNSDVQLEDRNHVARLREVFAAADGAGMAIVLHMRPSVNMRRPFGATQARIFLEQLLPSAPKVPVQIAHLSGAGGFDDPAIDEALEVFVQAIAAGDPRMKNVLFDVSGVAGIGKWKAKADRIAQRIRQLGVSRVLYGSDGAVPGNSPREAWQTFRQLPLTDGEFRIIAANSAPYLKRN